MSPFREPDVKRAYDRLYNRTRRTGRFTETNVQLFEARLATLAEAIWTKGPMTVRDMKSLWAIGHAEMYHILHTAIDRGLLIAVAHVHGRGGYPSAVYDVAAAENLRYARATKYLGGRFCTMKHRIGGSA